ncbi:hypothetical protein L798_13378 [Zootermopsis nevadensis]|uniref:Uncharacterized protein n=1 Tax=Zootermopsis nevadensis TaxID=136037 RepID=A0A067QT61_ZOONE|nr:hypothetical protein L798_13378 [Zootermopsis nevadensis]
MQYHHRHYNILCNESTNKTTLWLVALAVTLTGKQTSGRVQCAASIAHALSLEHSLIEVLTGYFQESFLKVVKTRVQVNVSVHCWYIVHNHFSTKPQFDTNNGALSYIPHMN